jgi:sulfur-carrier protein adenylyltransferase/sulfurtransferase
VTENIGEDPVQAAKRQIEEVTPEQVLEMQANGEDVVYLDVREPREWNLGRLPHAVHLPLGDLEHKVGDLIDRDRRVVVYCARGNRSALAALAMKRMGYDKAASMARGITGWADVNGEIEE